jgi:cysteinyl-tRNA synthetase
MSSSQLGQPFDIHTGGVDLIFPHHENEIAQSTADAQDPVYAQYFVHNEHLLVEGKKMSKSLGNFFTLRDIQEKGFDPLAFRLMMLQAHYRSQTNFTWENLEAAQNRLKRWQATADLKWQHNKSTEAFKQEFSSKLLTTLGNDLDTPGAMLVIEEALAEAEQLHIDENFDQFIDLIDRALGLKLSRNDISDENKSTLTERQAARDSKDFAKSDELRDKLAEQGIGVRDTPQGQIWFHQ